MADALDILGFNQKPCDDQLTKDKLFQKKVVKQAPKAVKKPTGMNREVWGLLWTDSQVSTPIVPSDSQGYVQNKARLGLGKVRRWRHAEFTNQARSDGLQLAHWQRDGSEPAEYPFAKFNKQVEVPFYTQSDYIQYLAKLSSDWTQDETDHLMSLCKRFERRFVVIHDRWDTETFKSRSLEELKARYYAVSNALIRAKGDGKSGIVVFDAEHERKRKEQLSLLLSRTKEQVDEEEYLIAELKRIELRKKDRERANQNLGKLITAAQQNIEKSEKRSTCRAASDADGVGRVTGTFLRSQKLKLPQTLGLKKAKLIEQFLASKGIPSNPIPTEELVPDFNTLRQNLILLSSLRDAQLSADYELQSLLSQYNAITGKTIDLDFTLERPSASSVQPTTPVPPPVAASSQADTDTGGESDTPGERKRRAAALQQSDLMKKITKR